MLRHIRHSLWAKRVVHDNYVGLEEGRNELVTASVRPHLNAQQCAFLDIIQSNAVLSPYLAHVKWGKTETGHCSKCNEPQAKRAHYVDRCPFILGRP